MIAWTGGIIVSTAILLPYFVKLSRRFGGFQGGGQMQMQANPWSTVEGVMCADSLGVPDPMCQGQGQGGFMSPAQVNKSSWPQCAPCLAHGRTLHYCTQIGECQGPWAD
jgi:hypothetical protein